MPAALDGAVPSLQARHEKQRLLFFAESLIQLHRWHCHKPRGRRLISAFSTFPPQYALSHTNSVAPLGSALRCPWRKIWEERTVSVLISRAYMRDLSTDQNTTPHIKRQENQRDTQLSVVRWYLRRQSQKPVLGLSLNLQTIRKALGRRNADFLGYLRCARPRKFNPSEDRI